MGPFTIHPLMVPIDLVLFAITLFVVPQLGRSFRVELGAHKVMRAGLAALILVVLVVWDLAAAMVLIGLVINRTTLAW